jgi:hypothetical protein
MEKCGGGLQDGSLGYPSLPLTWRKVVGIYKKVAWDTAVSPLHGVKSGRDLLEGSLGYPRLPLTWRKVVGIYEKIAWFIPPFMEISDGDLREGSLVYPLLHGEN